MVNVISLPYIFQVLFVLCFTRPRYQVSVPLVLWFYFLLKRYIVGTLYNHLLDESLMCTVSNSFYEDMIFLIAFIVCHSCW